MIRRFSDDCLDRRYLIRDRVSSLRPIRGRVYEAFIPYVHPQFEMAKKVHTDDRCVNVRYYETPFHRSTQ